jgi:hypothetical protein
MPRSPTPLYIGSRTPITPSLQRVYTALLPNGRFVVEMGGHGNIAALITIGRSDLLATEAALNYFPTPAQYRARLEQAIALHHRPTRLNERGVRGWYDTFHAGGREWSVDSGLCEVEVSVS